MNPRTTGLLALAAAILGGFIYFYEIGGESARQALLDDDNRIYPGLDAEEIDAIELTTREGVPARFERRQGRWWIVAPVVGRADATALEAIADGLTRLSREGSVQTPGEWKKYGLGEDARTVIFEVAGERERLLIGRATPVGGNVYVARLATESIQVEDVNYTSSSREPGSRESAEAVDSTDDAADGIVYVQSYRTNAFKRSLKDLRDRRLFAFDAGEVRTLRVSWPSPGGLPGSEVEVALARDESGEWQMGVPVTGPADQQTVRELLSDLSFLRAKGFVDVRTDEVEVALAHPAMTFNWTLVGEHLERRARIGGTFGEGLLVEGPTGEVHTIDVERLENFKRSVSDYRFKMLSEFEVSRARRLVLEFSDEEEGVLRVEAGLFEAGWTSQDPRIDPDRASDLIRELASLRATDIFADQMGPAELASLNLSPPRLRVRVEDRAEPDAGTQVLAEVAIGRLDADRGLFAQRVGEEMVFVLSESVADEIPISRLAFSNAFEVQPDDDAVKDGVELDLEDLGSDPLEGLQIP